MTAINSVEVHIVTGSRQRGGTDERVFLGLGGHEFELDSMANDFERGTDRTYVLGHGANISHAGANDPRRLTLEEIQAAPVYLRVGDPAAPAHDEETRRGRDPFSDALNRVQHFANAAGSAIHEGLMHAASTAHSYWSSGNWNLEEVTVTVHPESGSPLTFSALQGPDNTWVGGRGQPQQLILTPATSG